MLSPPGSFKGKLPFLKKLKVIVVTLLNNIIQVQVYNSTIHHCIFHYVLTTQSPVSFYDHIFDPLYPLHPPPSLSLSSNHHSVVCIYEQMKQINLCF